MRGSVVLLKTRTFRSGEYQVSVVITIGCSLPMAPAGIVRVVRVPCAGTPSMVWVPRSTLLTFEFEGTWFLAMTWTCGPESVAAPVERNQVLSGATGGATKGPKAGPLICADCI